MKKFVGLLDDYLKIIIGGNNYIDILIFSQKFWFICLVRHPVERLLSAYRDRLLGRKLARSQVLKMFQRLNITTTPGPLRNNIRLWNNFLKLQTFKTFPSFKAKLCSSAGVLHPVPDLSKLRAETSPCRVGGSLFSFFSNLQWARM